MQQRTHRERATQSHVGPAGARAPLRVGLLVDAPVQPAWVARLVSEIGASTFARVVVLATAAGEPRRESLLRRLWRGLFHDVYLRLDEALFPGDPDALAPTDLRPLLPGCPEVGIAAADVGRLREHDLDVAIVQSRVLRPADCSRIARHGAWSLCGAAADEAEAAAGMLEVLRGEGSTPVEVEAWTSATRQVIGRSHGPTEPVSVRCNRDRLCWKGSALLLRGLRDLAERGATTAEAGAPAPPPLKPTNLAMAALSLRHALRYARRKLLDLVTNEQWYLAYRFEDAPGDFTRLLEAMPPKDRYWADPFPVRTRDGRTFLFFEELRYKDPKGRILAMEIDREKGPGEPFLVLERDYHLSYPHVFEWQGQYWMVPESSKNRTVTLFRCESFPDRWVEERDLLRGIEAVDTTLEEIDGRWWMFVNVTAYGAGNRDELHVYHAETPLGPWTPHAGNPVRSDCRGARPAGRLFRRDGKLFRPAQNCAGGYGTSIVIHRIDVLTTSAFRETPVAEILPDWDPKARRAHTINRCEGFLVLDLLRRRRRF
jgi:hypothetical protein